MVVSGSVEKPLLGMLHRDGTPEDLCDCPLYPASFAPVFAALKPFIARAGLTPYNVARKRGELKYILLTESQSDGGMMLRFVLRSETKLAQLRKALPWLQEQTAAAKSYYRQYSAGTYGDYGRGDGDLPDRTTGTGRAF